MKGNAVIKEKVSETVSSAKDMSLASRTRRRTITSLSSREIGVTRVYTHILTGPRVCTFSRRAQDERGREARRDAK